MDHLTEAVRAAIKDKNWHGALSLSLTLPDICGKLQSPTAKSGPRFKAWWEKYCADKYTVGPSRRKILSGSDAYALRCAFLHEGGDDITEQQARDVLSRFTFIYPPDNGSMHCNLFGDTLQLQVDRFCTDICDGVDAWLKEFSADNEVQGRLKELLIIKSAQQAFG